MRIPRFHIRTLMIAVAVVATILGPGVEAMRLRRISVSRWQQANKLRGFEKIGLRSIADAQTLIGKLHEGARQARDHQVPAIWSVTWRAEFRSRVRIAESSGEDTQKLFEQLAEDVDHHARGFEKVLEKTTNRYNSLRTLRREYERASWLPWVPEPRQPVELD